MQIRSIALLAITMPGLYCAANPSSAPLAVYYHFSSPPAAGLVPEMQAELGRILDPADLRITLRTLDPPNRTAEEFQGIVVFRFRGDCSFTDDRTSVDGLFNLNGERLADTQLVDGHVLPFGEVDCNSLRQFIAPALRFLDMDQKNAALARAIARVSAHEIYHMLTQSEKHARKGIARASQTRTDLTSPTFGFGQTEIDWLRGWVNKNSDPPAIAADAAPKTSPPYADSPAPESAGFDTR